MIMGLGQEIGDTPTNGFYSSAVMPWMRENVPYLAEANQAFASAIKPEGTTQEATASIASPLAQVVVPGSIFTRAFRAAGITSRIMSETLGYSAAEIAAVDPKDATMMELGLQLVDDEPEVQSIMEQAFATKEDESDFLKRIKNSPRKIVESGVTGIIAERSFQALGMAYRTLRNSPKFKQVQAQSVEDALVEPPAFWCPN
jgi:hypothetical protein